MRPNSGHSGFSLFSLSLHAYFAFVWLLAILDCILFLQLRLEDEAPSAALALCLLGHSWYVSVSKGFQEVRDEATWFILHPAPPLGVFMASGLTPGHPITYQLFARVPRVKGMWLKCNELCGSMVQVITSVPQLTSDLGEFISLSFFSTSKLGQLIFGGELF